MVKFLPIKKSEAYNDGTLVWEYRSYVTVNGKSAGAVFGWTEAECQAQIDRYEANPDEWVSKAMSMGWL